MKITTIRVERLHTFASFENQKFTAEAIVGDGEDPAEAGKTLRNFVEDQIEAADREREERLYGRTDEEDESESLAGNDYDHFAEE